jgi:hypothetical protein
MTILVYLLLAHLLCDYALQGDFMAKAKNRYAPIPGVPAVTVLLSHAAIHAAAVYLITGSAVYAAFEFGAHAAIDDWKCSGGITFNADQLLHVLCKVGYVIAICLKDSQT